MQLNKPLVIDEGFLYFNNKTMKKYILLLNLILLSCSEGISEKSLIGEWVTEKGGLIVMDESILITDGYENKYSIEDINQDLGIIKASFLTYEGIPADVQFVVKDENNLQITIFGLMTEDLIRLPDFSEFSLFDEVPENIIEYWLKSEYDNINILYYIYEDFSEYLIDNDEFAANFKKENPDFNVNSTYLDVSNALINYYDSLDEEESQKYNYVSKGDSDMKKEYSALMKFIEELDDTY
jgi:hypothetical protein